MTARAIVFVLLSMLACSSHAFGIEDATAPDAEHPALQLRIWYPTRAENEMAVEGMRLPLIVISHGTGGGLTGHEDLAQTLADAGFVAVAVMHTGNNYRDMSAVKRGTDLIDRPRHVSRTIDYMLTRWRAAKQLDAGRIGVFGFSSGGFTALVVAGAEPDLSRTAAFCRERTEAWTCNYLRKNGVDPLREYRPRAIRWLHDTRVRAVVAAAPAVGYAYDADSVRNVHVPIQLWNGRNDRVVEDSAQRIRALLPAAEYHDVANAGHFSFMAPCDWHMRMLIGVLHWFGTEAICSDPDGFDRTAFHRDFNRSVARFFVSNLR